MKYVIDKRIQILIKNGLFDIEHLFLVYDNNYFKNWIVISKYLKGNSLVGYTVYQDKREYVTLSFLTFDLALRANSEGYPYEAMYIPIPKRDKRFFEIMISKINYTVNKLDLKAKHQAALISPNRMIKF